MHGGKTLCSASLNWAREHISQLSRMRTDDASLGTNCKYTALTLGWGKKGRTKYLVFCGRKKNQTTLHRNSHKYNAQISPSQARTQPGWTTAAGREVGGGTVG